MTPKLPALFTAIALVSTTASRALAYDCSEATYQAARAKVAQSFEAGILRKDAASTYSVLVSDDYWNGLSFADKTKFAEDIICATAGAGKILDLFTLKSLANGKIIGQWNPLGGLSGP